MSIRNLLKIFYYNGNDNDILPFIYAVDFDMLMSAEFQPPEISIRE